MDPAQMATEHLEAELVSHAAWETAGLARMVSVLAEFDRRQAWAAWECVSAQHWMSWKCGLGYTAATERLRVGHALAELPTMAAWFAEARLSWSKVRELTRVATPDTELTWCQLAEAMTAAQLAKLTRAHRRVTAHDADHQIRERGLTWATEDDGSLTLRLRLPADRAMEVIGAVRAATTPVKGERWAAMAADAMVGLVLGDATVTPEVVVHIHDDVTAYLEGGPAIAPEIAEALCCTGSVTTVVHTPAGPIEKDRQTAPNARQRRWLALRHPTCQFPGCHHDGTFDAHHVVERHLGGRTTLPNLMRLCWFHHRQVHLHRLVLTMHADRSVTVVTPAGRPIDRPIAPARFRAPAPKRLDRIGGQWMGDRLDIAACLDAVLVSPRRNQVTPTAAP